MCALNLIQDRIAQASGAASDVDLGSLAVAFHNLGVEQEFLNQRQTAVESFRRATDIAQAAFGAEHSMTKTFAHSLKSARYSLLVRPPIHPSKGPSARKGMWSICSAYYANYYCFPMQLLCPRRRLHRPPTFSNSRRLCESIV